MNDLILISSDKSFITEIRDAFKHEAYTIQILSDKDLSLINSSSIILIFSCDAADLLHKIRKISNAGVIIIENQSSNAHKFLELGADDFMSLPIDFKELLARCRAVARRSMASAKRKRNVIRYDGLVISKDSYDVRIQDRFVPLSSREFEILYLLASNPNKVLTRDEILNGAYGREYMGDLRSVDVHIKKIRDKVENPNNSWSIKTVRGVGYKFTL